MAEKTEKKVVDYRVVYDNVLHSFEEQIRGLISAGWEPVGGVALASPGFYQAMVKKEASYDYPMR